MDQGAEADASELVFKGVDGAEAEAFIMSVQQKARAAGRLRDNDWIVDLASTCMTGAALRWYIELGDETQNEWKALRKAILNRWPLTSTPFPSSAVSAPATPPTIPAAAAAAARPPDLTHASDHPKGTYLVRVYPAAYIAEPFYLTCKEGVAGAASIKLTSRLSKALKVKLTPQKELMTIENGVETPRMVSMAWYSGGGEDHSETNLVTNFALFFVANPAGDQPLSGIEGGPLKATSKFNIIKWTIDETGFITNYSTVAGDKTPHLFYTAKEEDLDDGSYTRICLPPGLENWKIGTERTFTMKLEPM